MINNVILPKQSKQARTRFSIFQISKFCSKTIKFCVRCFDGKHISYGSNESFEIEKLMKLFLTSGLCLNGETIGYGDLSLFIYLCSCFTMFLV